MSDVKRWKLKDMLPVPNSAPINKPEVVLASDYDSLLSERDQLKAKLAELKARPTLLDIGVIGRSEVTHDIRPDRELTPPFAVKIEVCDVKKTGD